MRRRRLQVRNFPPLDFLGQQAAIDHRFVIRQHHASAAHERQENLQGEYVERNGCH